MTDEIEYRWGGRLLSDMSKDELIDVLKQFTRKYYVELVRLPTLVSGDENGWTVERSSPHHPGQVDKAFFTGPNAERHAYYYEYYVRYELGPERIPG